MRARPFPESSWPALLLLAAALLFSRSSPAQQTGDTLRDTEVLSRRAGPGTVEGKLKIYTPGTKSTTFDSATLERYRQQSVAALLAQQSPVFVRSYGFNNLATLQFRGASSAQSLVVWNGVPLQNAATGITDVSLLPVLLADNISLQFGSSAALLGSGNVGGALLLSSRPARDSFLKEATLYSGTGSFRQYGAGGRLRYNYGRWQAAGRFFYQRAVNDFSYEKLDGSTAKTSNGQSEGWSAAADGRLLVNRSNSLNLHGWLRKSERGIPPALLQRQSVQQLRDGALRLAADWQHEGRTDWYLRAAGISDRLVYDDSAIRVHSDARVLTFFAEAGAEWRVGKRQRLLLFVPVQQSRLFANDTAYQNRIAAAIAHQWRPLKNARLVVGSGLRAEKVETLSYLLPGLNLSYQAFGWLQLKVNGQRTYRAPTLNELYYDPGGNRDLLPESGWNVDGGCQMQFAFGEKASLKHEVSFYSRWIDNWVAWFGGSIWTPHNIAAVHSRGVELDCELNFPLGPVGIRAAAHGALSRSTTERSLLPGDKSIGRQVPYAPQVLAQGGLSADWKGFLLSFYHSYTGVRYVTTDESFGLPAYQLSGLQLAWTRQARRFGWRLDAACNNLFDADYVVVAARPMPGRYFSLGLSLSYRDARHP